MDAVSAGMKASNSGGEGGIRTLGTGFSPYNGLANRRIRPLCHLSGACGNSVYHGRELCRRRRLAEPERSATRESGIALPAFLCKGSPSFAR